MASKQETVVERSPRMQSDEIFDPLYAAGLCLLYLNGGRVRELSALCILKGLTMGLNHEL